MANIIKAKIWFISKNAPHINPNRIACDKASPKYANFFHNTKTPRIDEAVEIRIIARRGKRRNDSMKIYDLRFARGS